MRATSSLLALALVSGAAQGEGHDERVYSATLDGLRRVKRAAGLDLTDARRDEVARAIGAAVPGEDGALVATALGGGLPQAGLWMGAVAVEESGLREDVEACHARGDGGRSWGLWQVHRPSQAEREAMCGPGGILAQARAGLARAAQCARGGARGANGLARCYVGGDDGGKRAGRYYSMGGR